MSASVSRAPSSSSTTRMFTLWFGTAGAASSANSFRSSRGNMGEIAPQGDRYTLIIHDTHREVYRHACRVDTAGALVLNWSSSGGGTMGAAQEPSSHRTRHTEFEARLRELMQPYARRVEYGNLRSQPSEWETPDGHKI